MKPTVVILLSDKRSGSTMFQSELCKHPDIRHVDYSPHTYFETHHWLKAAVMLGIEPEKFSGGKVYAGYGSKKNARIYMEDCILGNIPTFEIPPDDRQLVFRGWEALCEKYATPVFFEKSPQFLAHQGCLELMLEWMRQAEFDVKIIGLVRNPLSVMASAQKLFHSDPEKRQYGWMDIYRNLDWFKGMLKEDQFMQCRYEDIISQPRDSFAKVCRFIGVEESDSVGSGVRNGSIEKWKHEPFFCFRLDDEVKAIAKSFGYSDEDLDNPEKTPPPFRLRIKRKLERVAKLSLARFKDRILIPAKLRKINR